VDADGRRVALATAEELRRDFERVDEASVLAELFGRFRSGLPVAVVDAEGRLRGMVAPTDLLAALGRLEEVAAPERGGREPEEEEVG